MTCSIEVCDLQHLYAYERMNMKKKNIYMKNVTNKWIPFSVDTIVLSDERINPFIHRSSFSKLRMNRKRRKESTIQFNESVDIRLFDVIQWVPVDRKDHVCASKFQKNGLKIKVCNDLIMNYYNYNNSRARIRKIG